MIYVFLANGFEEVEALAPLDFLLRAGVDAKTVGVSGKFCRGAHGVNIQADVSLEDMKLDKNLEGIILPGGMPGAENLNNSLEVQEAIDYCFENNLIISAICAAPFVLGRKGILKGKKATCYPGFESELEGATVLSQGVVVDGNIVTGIGPGAAWEFGAAISNILVGEEKTSQILRGIQWKK